jgi:hypothetical protein
MPGRGGRLVLSSQCNQLGGVGKSYELAFVNSKFGCMTDQLGPALPVVLLVMSLTIHSSQESSSYRMRNQPKGQQTVVSHLASMLT